MTSGTGAAAEPTTPSQGGKVFVGNLAFKTRNSGLKEAFEKIGPVQQVRVVTQGRRSLGYGFVVFTNPEDAQKAVEQFHRSSLDGREINVEVSTSPNTTPAPAANNSNDGAAARPKTVKRKRTFKKKSPDATGGSPRAASAPTGDKPAATPEGGDNAKPKKPRKKRTPVKPREPREPKEPREPREPREPSTQPKRQPRAPRAPRENTDTSSTVVYVSNLPFSLTDEALKADFADLGAVSANIIRRKRNNQSKGFGFVEFGTEAQQTAAIDAKHKSKIQDREISVRKAYVRPPIESAAPAAAPTKTEA